MRFFSLLGVIALCHLISGCDAFAGFPQDQKVEGPFWVSGSWLYVEPDSPLEVSVRGIQRLHLVVDADLYQANSLVANEGVEDPGGLFGLRDAKGQLVVPEVMLVAEDGSTVTLSPASNMLPYSGGLTVGMGLFNGVYEPAPPFPDGVQRFTSFRVRSNQPLSVEYFWWSVDRHPDMFQ